jgi:hypothetical protein
MHSIGVTENTQFSHTDSPLNPIANLRLILTIHPSCWTKPVAVVAAATEDGDPAYSIVKIAVLMLTFRILDAGLHQHDVHFVKNCSL